MNHVKPPFIVFSVSSRYNQQNFYHMSKENNDDFSRESLSVEDQKKFDELNDFITRYNDRLDNDFELKINQLTFELQQRMQIAAEENQPDEEMMLIQDEYVRKFTSSATNVIGKRLKFLVDIGLITEEEAVDQVKDVEGFKEITDYPKASWIIAHKQDNDGWLANWLPQNPGFFENAMGGEWPEWLAPPTQSLDKLQ